MKKLGPINPDIENWDLLLLACGKIDDLIDLVNSQQEAIEKLEKRLSFFEVYGNPSSPPLEPADDKPEYNFDKFAQGAREYAEKNDTHRTVTLRIPKGMRIGEAMWKARTSPGLQYLDTFWDLSDTDLQKALDEVQPNE